MDIGGDRQEGFPADFKILKPRDNILLIQSDAKRTFYAINEREKIPLFSKQDTTNWLLAASGTYNAGDMTDYLEPEDDVLYMLTFGLASDRNVEVEVNIPASQRAFGIKKESPIKITPETSPYECPTVTLVTWGKTFIPSFDITNPTEYTVGYLKMFFKGFKYSLARIESATTYDIIDLRRITV